MNLSLQVVHLFLLSIPIACITWTVTHEEIFSELRHYCVNKTKNGRNIIVCKFFYLFTCEYCFSHYVTIFFLIITGYKLMYDDWRGVLIGGFSLVWIANLYISIFAFLRQGIKKEKIEANIKGKELEELKEE